MKRSHAPLVAALAAASAFAQTPKLDDAAHFVAERANDVRWNQDGQFLGFSYCDAGGHVAEYGIYDMAHRRGNVLFKAEPRQTVDDSQWLAGDPVELLATHEPVTLEGKPAVRDRLWALDGRRQTAKALWTMDFPEAQRPRLSIEASPSLSHAIVTVKTDAATAYLVVTLGADGVVVSTDISQAISQGYGFAGWTLDGTAWFGNGIHNDLASEQILGRLNLVTADNLSLGNGATFEVNIAQADQGEVSQAVVLELDRAIADEARVFRLVGRARPAIAAGAVGLELMPTNGVLRQVKFPGYWQDGTTEPPSTELDAKDEPLAYRSSKAATHSVWLKPAGKDAKVGILVSPQAEQSWLHPDGRTVAFTFNGTLFVRTVNIGRQ